MKTSATKLNPELMPTDAAKNLVAAIIELAIIDFKKLKNSGKILKDNSPNAIAGAFRVSQDYRHPAKVKELLYFLRPGGLMDRWIDLGGLEISGDAIREGLGY